MSNPISLEGGPTRQTFYEEPVVAPVAQAPAGVARAEPTLCVAFNRLSPAETCQLFVGAGGTTVAMVAAGGGLLPGAVVCAATAAVYEAVPYICSEPEPQNMR